MDLKYMDDYLVSVWNNPDDISDYKLQEKIKTKALYVLVVSCYTKWCFKLFVMI